MVSLNMFNLNLRMKKFSYKIGCNLKLQPKATTLLNIINIIIYFENLIIGLHFPYALNTYVKFCDNQILFTIWFIRLYFMHNFKLQRLAI